MMLETVLGTFGADTFTTIFWYLVVGIGAAWVLIGLAIVVSAVRHIREERRERAAEAIWAQLPEVER